MASAHSKCSLICECMSVHTSQRSWEPLGSTQLWEEAVTGQCVEQNAASPSGIQGAALASPELVRILESQTLPRLSLSQQPDDGVHVTF